MTRTLITLFFLFIAALYLPAGVQVVLHVIALFVVPQRLTLFIPAIFSDALYGVTPIPLVSMTAIVAVLLLIRWLLAMHTRIGSIFYGVAQE